MIPDRILVRAPTWIGDAVMATPVLRALRGSYPHAEIVVEGRPLLAELLAGLDSFDRFLPDPGGGAIAMVSRAARLRRERFDWAVLLPDSQRAALGPFLAGVPKRIGYARDPLRRWLLTETLDPPHRNGERIPVPMTERYLAIANRLGCSVGNDCLELVVRSDDDERTTSSLLRHGVGTDEPLLIVTPGAAFGASKLWPVEHFASACDGIAARLGLVPVLAPGPGEAPIAKRIAGLSEKRIVCLDDPSPGIAEVKALVRRAKLLLTNDTGPRHIAVAVGTPVVVLMGPTDPRHTQQHMERQRVLREDVDCSPCQRKTCPIDHRCMTRLSPERAISAAQELIVESLPD